MVYIGHKLAHHKSAQTITHQTKSPAALSILERSSLLKHALATPLPNQANFLRQQ